MKKTLAIVLMVLCVFSAFAQGATEGTTATDDQVKVVLLTDATGIDDLKGAKIDCITGDYATGLLEDYLKENPGAFEIVYTEGTMAMILEDIVNGRVAGNVNDPFTINTTAEENKISDKVKLVGDELFSDYVFAAFAKTDEGAQMRDDFDEAIQSMIEDGTLEEMSNNTFNYNYNGTLKDGIVK